MIFTWMLKLNKQVNNNQKTKGNKQMNKSWACSKAKLASNFP